MAEPEVQTESLPEDKAKCSDDKPMSKRQMKRLKKAEEKLKHRAEWRAQERMKKKARLKAKKEQGIELGPSRKRLKTNSMEKSQCRIRVAVDCQFDHLMSQKQVNDLVAQLQYSYSSNRRADNPLQFYVTSLVGKTLDRLESIGQYKNWDIHFETRDYLSVFDKSQLVYLSSESPNVLQELDEDHVYVIGGLVDYNHHKGLCHKLATEKGVQHAKLPIGEHLKLDSRKVLTINHVFDILLSFTETKNWKESFLKVIPQRKGLTVLEKTNSDRTSDDSNNLTDELDCDDLEGQGHLQGQIDELNFESDESNAKEAESNSSNEDSKDASSDLSDSPSSDAVITNIAADATSSKEASVESAESSLKSAG